jgi:flagellar basal-body rod protein FlgB
MNLLQNKIIDRLVNALDVSAFRSKLLSQNVANVNTPYYKRLDVDFQGLLEQKIANGELEIKRTHPKHFGPAVPEAGPPKVTRETKTIERFDQNNIDVEFEMAQVEENSLFFQANSQRLKGKFSGLRKVIKGQ